MIRASRDPSASSMYPMYYEMMANHGIDMKDYRVHHFQYGDIFETEIEGRLERCREVLAIVYENIHNGELKTVTL